MMDQFVVRYIPGGMSLHHSAWWVCDATYTGGGTFFERPVKYLRKADYK